MLHTNRVKVEIDLDNDKLEYESIGTAHLTVGGMSVTRSRIGVCVGSECSKIENRPFRPDHTRLWSIYKPGESITMRDGSTIIQKPVVNIPQNSAALPLGPSFKKGPQAVYMYSRSSRRMGIADLVSYSSNKKMTFD